MADERDPGRPAGADLTPGGGMDATGTPRTPGTGEVHGGMRTGPGGEEYGALGFGTEGTAEGVRERAAAATREFAGDVRDRAENLGDRAKHAAEDVRDKAERFTSEARHRIDDVRDRAEDLVGEDGLTGRIRQHPLPAIAIGFGVGYLLAGRGPKRGPVHFAKSKLRKALFGTLVAAVAREARGLVTSELTSALFGGGDDRDDERDDFAPRARSRRPSHREF